MRRLLALSIAAGSALLLAPTALAGSLPSPGTWLYDSGKGTKGVPDFQVYVSVNTDLGTPSVIYAVHGAAWGKCSHGPNFVDFDVDTAANIKIPIKPDGSFSTKWFKTIGDAAGEKGKAKLKGTFNGTTVKGTVTVREQGGAFGKCSASRKKFKAKGEQIA